MTSITTTCDRQSQRVSALRLRAMMMMTTATYYGESADDDEDDDDNHRHDDAEDARGSTLWRWLSGGLLVGWVLAG